MIKIYRRTFIAACLGALALTVSAPVKALETSDAKAHVQKTLNDILALLKQPGTGESRAPQLQAIMESRANVPLLARFSAGRAWREMSDDQKDEFVQAFSRYIAVTYSRRFDEYSGDPKIEIGKTIDAGRKGILVESPIVVPNGEPIAIEWLVSDRGGRTEVVDLIIEGISMAATQREEINAMLDKRSGNVDKLIAHLRTTQ
ncbi:MAG: ABC transporter substrate-binding protein [Pseudomonadota bacterium]